MLQEDCDASPDQNGVALEDVDVPQSRCLVECDMPGEERGKDVAQVYIGIVISQSRQMSMQFWGFCCEGLQ